LVGAIIMCEKYSYEIVIIQTDKAHTFYVYTWGLLRFVPIALTMVKFGSAVNTHSYKVHALQ